MMAACLVVGPGAVVSHRAAAAIWQMRGIPDPPVEITSTDRHRAIAGARLHVARVDPEDATWRGRFRVTRPERTIFDLAAVVRRDRVETALDDGLLRGLIDFSVLANVHARLARRGRRGSTVMGELMSTRDPSLAETESQLEAAILKAIRRAGLPEPVCQHPVADDIGRMRLDFAYPRERVGIECDSVRWHCARADLERNTVRRNRLLHLGWRVLALTWSDATDRPTYVASTIRRELRRTASNGPAPATAHV